jgi:hypothetical protein
MMDANHNNLIITSLTIGIVILNKVKISRTQPRKVNMITASAPCCDTEILIKSNKIKKINQRNKIKLTYIYINNNLFFEESLL